MDIYLNIPYAVLDYSSEYKYNTVIYKSLNNTEHRKQLLKKYRLYKTIKYRTLTSKQVTLLHNAVLNSIDEEYNIYINTDVAKLSGNTTIDGNTATFQTKGDLVDLVEGDKITLEYNGIIREFTFNSYRYLVDNKIYFNETSDVFFPSGDTTITAIKKRRIIEKNVNIEDGFKRYSNATVKFEVKTRFSETYNSDRQLYNDFYYYTKFFIKNRLNNTNYNRNNINDWKFDGKEFNNTLKVVNEKNYIKINSSLTLEEFEKNDLRLMFKYLQGKTKPFWLNTFINNHTLVQNTQEGDNFIILQGGGYFENFNKGLNRHLIIFYRNYKDTLDNINDSYVFTKITNVEILDNVENIEKIYLDITLDNNFINKSNEELIINDLLLVRLDSDAISFSRIAYDINEVNLSFKELQNITP